MMQKEPVDIGAIIAEETERRLDLMESPDYVMPEKAGKEDAIMIVAAIVICGLLILGCMTGVIV